MITNSGNALAGGDAIKLFAATSYIGSFGSIQPNSPGSYLAWNTNTLDTDGTLRVLALTNLTPTNLVFMLSSNQLTLSWPSDHTGWTLQEQTNPPGVGLTTSWVTVAASATTNQVTMPINLGDGSAFYRMILNP